MKIRGVLSLYLPCACLLSNLFYCVASHADTDNLTFSGYVKSYALGQDNITLEDVDNNNADQSIAGNFQSQNALRLMGSYLSPGNGNIEIHYEIQPWYFSNTNFITDNSGSTGSGSASLGSTISIANNQYRFKDLKPVLKEIGDNSVILQNLDRFNYQYSNKYGDLTIGRQVLSFGSARFINPTDIFIPFAIQTLNQEYRVGIDAIRYKADLGDFAVLDTGIIVGEDGKKENSAAFIRGKNSVSGNDIEAMFIFLDDAWLLGAGIERAIGDFGFWFETAYMDWHQSSANNNDTLLLESKEDTYTQSYWRTSIGSDYALTEDIIVMLEYHYNGAGSKDALQYQHLTSQAPYQKAGVFLLGQHYIIPALTWLATPLLSVNASAFYNISDNSVFINLSSETSWSDNLYSDFGLYLSSGENLQYHTGSDMDISFGSEFGAYPLSIYASLRYYF